jgi:multidrug resistance protein MdtO
MASEPIHLPHEEHFSEWFPNFLKKELAPYPGRGALVARIVISATLTMIIIETFRIPGGVLGALTAFFLFAREPCRHSSFGNFHDGIVSDRSSFHTRWRTFSGFHP